MLSRPLCRPLLLAATLASLAACGSLHDPAQPAENAADRTLLVTPPETATASGADLSLPGESTVVAAPPTANPAVIALLDSAHADASAGRLPSAGAALERALRIEPRNPQLWHELAKVKLQKGEYREAENFAARSNSWAAANKALQAKNWRLISESRALRGDNAGARAALARARALEAAAE